MVWYRSLAPAAGLLATLIALALALDGLLHIVDWPQAGRYLGYVGTALIALSFLYSARKRRWFQWGKPMHWLTAHEVLAWAGSVLVLVHGGVHFNAALPWMAMVALLVAVASGLIGRHLLQDARALLAAKRKALAQEGHDEAAREERLYWDSLVVAAMERWRRIHLPITGVMVFLAVLHVGALLVLWRW